MAIFLKVLGIIGIVLLSILGLILLVLFLVLFVPVRYKAEGSFKENKPSFSARASWLLHLVSVRFTLGEEEPLIIRVCGFKIKKKEEKKPDFEEDTYETDDIKEYPQVTDDIMLPVPESPDEPIQEETAPESQVMAESTSTESVVSEPVVSESVNSEPSEDSDISEESPKKPKIAEAHKKPRKSPENEDSKKDFENRSFYDKIKKYIEIIESKRFKQAFEYSKDKIVKLLKHILPRRFNIYGEVGFDDPSVTGQILVITSMLIPIVGDKINIQGNFEEPVIDIEGKLKGRITLFKVLWTLAVLYFNKNIRKIIKMFREV